MRVAAPCSMTTAPPRSTGFPPASGFEGVKHSGAGPKSGRDVGVPRIFMRAFMPAKACPKILRRAYSPSVTPHFPAVVFQLDIVVMLN